ncbi:MAG: hypothetical protein ABUL72_01210, partial [Armatimonadota bacterium]
FDYEPPPHQLGVLMESRLRYGAMKLSPMLSDGVLRSIGPSVAFVSYGRECRESLVHIGKAVSTEQFYALKIETGDSIQPGEPAHAVSEPMAYLYEADPAAIRAHSLGALAAEFSLAELSNTFGYLTGDSLVTSPWLVGYRVIETGPYDEKQLRLSLSKLGGGRPIVKSRARKIDPAKISKELSTPGKGEPIVALYDIKFSLRYVILERLS